MRFFCCQEDGSNSWSNGYANSRSIKRNDLSEKNKKNSNWKQTFKTVCESYENLKPTFEIRHDNFGGYTIFYVGENIIKPWSVLKRNPVGFVREVPEGSVTDLSIMSSERTGKPLLLLGPMRFLNSDCSPNCEYDFSSKLNTVQLRARRSIKPGDEIFVKYAPDFFESNACFCQTTEIRGKKEFEYISVFDQLVEDAFFEVVTSTVGQLLEESDLNEKPFKPKSSRVKGRKLIELFNDLARSPISSCSSLENSSDCTIECSISSEESSTNNSSVELQTESDYENNFSTDNESPASDGLTTSNSNNQEEGDLKNFVLARASSPMSQHATISFFTINHRRWDSCLFTRT